MPLYRILDGKFTQLKHKLVQKEKELQQAIEANLLELLNINFLETEYITTSGGRIDTLGIDQDGAPVIIEYKRNQNDNVINQALSYLKWLTGQKSEFFEMLMKKHLATELSAAIQLDWKRPRVICIAEKFSKFDTDTADVLFPVFRVELMTYKFYENDLFLLETRFVDKDQSKKQVSASGKAATAEVVSGEVLIESHRSHGSSEIQKLFDELRSRIVNLDALIEERPVGAYIGYRVSKNFAQVHVQKSQVWIALRPIEYNDPRGFIKPTSNLQWTLNRQVTFNNAADLDYIMQLVEQSYNDVT